MSSHPSPLSTAEHKIIERLRGRKRVARNINVDYESSLTVGQRVADRVAEFGGSWTFILMFTMILVGWIVLNTAVLVGRPYDPYPFILLNLILSTLAALQAPVIMMSQNRQAAKDRLDAEHDYEVNLKAEMEIEELHAKIDALREAQWAELVAMQQEQIRLLMTIVRRNESGGEQRG